MKVDRWNLVIKQLRVMENWSQSELASNFGGSITTVSRWESGTASPKKEIQEKIIEFCRNRGYSEILDLIGLSVISLRLLWYHQGQFAGFYIAEKKGRYENIGRKIFIEEGGTSKYTNPIECVAEGRDNFGLCGPLNLIKAVDEGKKIKAIMAIFQQSPSCLITKDEIDGDFKKLDEKVVGLISEENVLHNECELLAKINNIRLAPRKISGDECFTPKLTLDSGKVHALSAYSFNEPYILAKEKYKYTKIELYKELSKIGVKTYGDILFTTEFMIKNRPNIVQSFVEASINGWKDLDDEINKGIEVVLGYIKDFSGSSFRLIHEDIQSKMLLDISKIIRDEYGRIGVMEAQRWQGMINILRQNGMISKNLLLEDVVDLSFVEKFYNKL